MRYIVNIKWGIFFFLVSERGKFDVMNENVGGGGEIAYSSVVFAVSE